MALTEVQHWSRLSEALDDVILWDQPIPRPEIGKIADLMGDWGWSATDGHYCADKAVIRPDHKRLHRYEMGRPSTIVGISIDNFLNSIDKALTFPTLERVIEDAKLTLSIELYAASRFELSERAQLLTLVTALEVLLPNTKISTHGHPH